METSLRPAEAASLLGPPVSWSRCRDRSWCRDRAGYETAGAGEERAGQVQAGPRPGVRVWSVCSRVSAQAWSAGDSVSASCWFQRPNLSFAGTGYISTRRLHYIVCELGGSVGASECRRWWLRVHSCLLGYSRLVGLTLRMRAAGQTFRGPAVTGLGRLLRAGTRAGHWLRGWRSP